VLEGLRVMEEERREGEKDRAKGDRLDLATTSKDS
jgi:hypothetical protein